MTAPPVVDPWIVLGEALSDASPDSMQHLLQAMIKALLPVDADAVVGAEWGQPSPDRLTHGKNRTQCESLRTRERDPDVADMPSEADHIL